MRKTRMLKTFKERLLKLADAIENGFKFEKRKVSFNMADWGAWRTYNPKGTKFMTCDSACCVGGHADLMFSVFGKDDVIKGSTRLGLTDDQEKELFYPEVPYVNQGRDELKIMDLANHKFFSRARAAATIRNLVKTGKVDWRGALQN